MDMIGLNLSTGFSKNDTVSSLYPPFQSCGSFMSLLRSFCAGRFQSKPKCAQLLLQRLGKWTVYCNVLFVRWPGKG